MNGGLLLGAGGAAVVDESTLLVYARSPAAVIETEVRDAFLLADADGDGLLQAADVRCAVIYLLGYSPSRLEVASMMARQAGGGASGGGGGVGMTMDAFVQAMAQRMRQQDVSVHLQQLFEAFDLRERGFIVWEDFLAITSPLARGTAAAHSTRTPQWSSSPPTLYPLHSSSAALCPVSCATACASAALSPSLLRRVFVAADRDGNGKVSYREFDRCMSNQYTQPLALPAAPHG